MGKFLLIGLLVLVVAVIVLTWGSIGSAVLTLALVLSLGYWLTLKVLENRDPDDFCWDG